MKKANTLTDLLHVYDIEQFYEPHNNNHFRVILTIKNTTASDCLSIITDYMNMAAEGDNLVFMIRLNQPIEIGIKIVFNN